MLEKRSIWTIYVYLKFLAKISKHSFSRKKSRFLTLDDRKRLKPSSKKGRPIKNQSVSERTKLGLSSHAFISISNFLTKTDFFDGEDGLKLISNVVDKTLLA